MGAILAEVLESGGYRAAKAVLPKKLLAVRSGLAAYGKNNITYVPGMGSFHGLVAVFSDLPAPEGTWRDAEMMEACHKCAACRRHCPTGAIDADRFLLRAERCLTFHNEKPVDVPFPGWIDAAWQAGEPGIEYDALPHVAVCYAWTHLLDHTHRFMSQNLGKADKGRQRVVKAGVHKYLLDVAAADATEGCPHDRPVVAQQRRFCNLL